MSRTNKQDIRTIEAEIVRHKATLERMGDEGHALPFELDYQAGMISGLTLALKVARRAKKR